MISLAEECPPNKECSMDYWQGPPPFAKLVFRPIPDETARTAALLSGDDAQ